MRLRPVFRSITTQDPVCSEKNRPSQRCGSRCLKTDATMAPASSASKGDGGYPSHVISGSLLRAAVDA
jgi:hypothetical protein